AGGAARGASGLATWSHHGARAGWVAPGVAGAAQGERAGGLVVVRHSALTWVLVGLLSVVAGTLWTFVAGGGFGVVLLGLKVFPIVIIGGLDSIPVTIVGAVVVGVLESLAAGYLDPYLGGGFSNVAAYLALIAPLFVRPYGLLGRPGIARV